MPRPKRSKITPSLVTPRNRRSKFERPSDVASIGSITSLGDLYDVSDQEDNRRVNFQDENRGKGKENQSLVSPLAQAFIEMEREQDIAGKKESTAFSKNIGTSEAEPGSLSSSPTLEIGRKEQSIPMEEDLEFVTGILKTQAKSADLDFFETSNSGETIPDESKFLDGNLGVKTRNLHQSVRQTSVSQISFNSQIGESQYGKNDGDEFSFDASTPQNISKTTKLDPSLSTTSSKSKKRKLSEVQVLRSSYEVSPPILSVTDEIIAATDPDRRESYEYTEEGRKGLMPSVESRSSTPQDVRDIMAPPHSSSSILLSPVAPSRSIRANSRNIRSLRNKTPRTRTDLDSDISSPPSLIHSPDLPSSTIKSRDKRQSSSPVPLTTAQLQALLPRRRRKAPDIFDGINSDDEIDTSGLASDEDELTHFIVGPRSRNRNRNRNTNPSKGPPARSSTLHKKSNEISKMKINNLKTYGSSDSHHLELMEETETDHRDKPLIEIDDHVSENTHELEERIGKELRKAVQKFKEVDKWILEFEDATGSSASSQDAR